jgi:predicted peroxiredoxin
MRVLIKSAWGSADPTQAAFPFHHAIAFAEAGHEVQIFLLGEAVSLMRSVVAASVVPVGWPPLSEALATLVAQRVPIHV